MYNTNLWIRRVILMGASLTFALCLNLFPAVAFDVLPETLSGEDSISVLVDQMPEFPGGRVALMEFLGAHIRYPDAARDSSVQGTVVLEFVVEIDGSITQLHVAGNLHPLCDAEALRVFGMMPAWQPGIHEGKPVRVRSFFPVRFKLRDPVPPGRIRGPREQLPPPEKPQTRLSADLEDRDPPGVFAGKVDKMPVFPGGNEEMNAFLRKHMRYPEEAREIKAQGVVVVTFVINVDGSVSNVSVLKSLSPACDDEAMRVVRLMPKWTPGIYDGKPVKVQYTLPVRFSIR